MSIKSYLQKLKTKLFLNAYQKTHMLTPKGEMVMYYILNKYINRTKPDDYIENYEESITNYEEKFVSAAQKYFELIPQEVKDEANMNENKEKSIRAMAHIFSAMYLFEIMLITIPEYLRNTWIEKIEDPYMKERMRTRIKKSIS